MARNLCLDARTSYFLVVLRSSSNFPTNQIVTLDFAFRQAGQSGVVTTFRLYMHVLARSRVWIHVRHTYFSATAVLVGPSI